MVGNNWAVNGQEMAEGIGVSGSEMGIEVDGGRGDVWCSAEDQRSKNRRKRMLYVMSSVKGEVNRTIV